MPALGTRCSTSLKDTLNYGLETAVLENDSVKPEHLEQALWKLLVEKVKSVSWR